MEERGKRWPTSGWLSEGSAHARAQASSGEAARREKRGQPPLPSRAFSQARCRYRFSSGLLDGGNKRQTARSIRNGWIHCIYVCILFLSCEQFQNQPFHISTTSEVNMDINSHLLDWLTLDTSPSHAAILCFSRLFVAVIFHRQMQPLGPLPPTRYALYHGGANWNLLSLVTRRYQYWI